MSTSATRIRAGAGALAAAGVLFLAYPALRPWHDESTVAGATASMSSTAWVAAHFFAMLGVHPACHWDCWPCARPRHHQGRAASPDRGRTRLDRLRPDASLLRS